MLSFFGREACGILAPRPGMEAGPPALEGEVLTTGSPGKSLYQAYRDFKYKVKHYMNPYPEYPKDLTSPAIG